MGKLSGCHIQREQSATGRDEAFLGSSLRAMLVTSWNGCILRKKALQLMLLLILPQAFEDEREAEKLSTHIHPRVSLQA